MPINEVEIIRTETMQLEHKVADIVDQTEQGLALFEERVKVAKKQLGLALKLAQPGQIMVYGEGDKQSIYLTAGASDRILRVGFGFRWANKTVQIHKDAEGVTAIATGDLLRHDGSPYESFSGSRRMVFDSQAKGGIKGYIKNEPDLIKAALQNMKHTAATDLLGVRFLSPADLKEIGVDLSKLERRVEFQDHGDDDNTAPVIAFGKNKGKPLTDLTDKQLEWYTNAARENLADASKSKWHSKEEKRLQEYISEQARRANTDTPPEEEPAAEDYSNVGPPPMSTTESKPEPGADG